jgi:hypothetical protein
VPEVPRFVSFLTDYGLADEFVGVCKAVMLRIAPELTIVDVTHEIAPHDVRAGALTLARAVQYLPSGIVLAVVDPGVGTDRRAVAVEVDDGYMLGPDNGLLAPAVAMLGGARRAVSLTNTEYQIAAPGATFAGRDIFAPAAGYLATGVALGDLGDEIDPALLLPGMLSLPRTDAGVMYAEVMWVDRFGNVQLNVDPDELDALGVPPGASVQVRVGDDVRIARRVATYGDAKPMELVALTDSYGLVSLALRQDSAAEALGARAGTSVTLECPQ